MIIIKLCFSAISYPTTTSSFLENNGSMCLMKWSSRLNLFWALMFWSPCSFSVCFHYCQSAGEFLFYCGVEVQGLIFHIPCSLNFFPLLLISGSYFCANSFFKFLSTFINFWVLFLYGCAYDYIFECLFLWFWYCCKLFKGV